jgi:hypothetical protein
LFRVSGSIREVTPAAKEQSPKITTGIPASVADVERAGRRKKGQESEEMNAVAPPAEEAGGE